MKPKILFSDFDGTLTLGTDMNPGFFHFLSMLNHHNIPLVIVSGRSVSWGHFFLTHFPIQHAIMEGGGVIINRTDHGPFEEINLVSDETIKELQKISKKVDKKFPGLMSSDSFGRRTDRALELPIIGEKMQQDIFAFFDEHGVNYSCSSVHINFWLDEITKFNGVKYFLEKYYPAVSTDDCLYFGDAPNDQSMFQYFENSVGVSNLLPYLEQIEHKPKTILFGEDKAGINGVISYLEDILN